MKRIAVALNDNDVENLSWIMKSTGCNQTEAVRLALDLVRGNFTADLVLTHSVMLRNADRERPAESD
jgi:hypothetical protein